LDVLCGNNTKDTPMKIVLFCIVFCMFSLPLFGQKLPIKKIPKPTTTLMTSDTILYFFDPLCGWCYGFSPVITSFYEKYSKEIAFDVISGGMITGERIGPIGEVASYIKTAYKTVEDRTGVKFGEPFLKDILDEGSTVFSSIPPSQVLMAVKQLAPIKAFAFASTLKKAIYYDGINLNSFEAYLPYVEAIGISKEAFMATVQSETTLEKTLSDFDVSETVGVTGFPTLIYIRDQKAHVLSQGYVTLDDLIERIEKLRK